MISEYDRMLGDLTPATDALLSRRSLQRRVDTKFLLPAAIVPDLVAALVADYAVVLAAGSPRATYRTLYFDTPELQCFRDHCRGSRPRHKVRIRHYPDREVSFLEIKTKRNELMTRKHRMAWPHGASALTDDGRAFIRAHCPLPPDQLAAQVWTNFSRVTLVGVAAAERLTIDTQLEFVDGASRHALPGVAIVEIKQSPYRARSRAMLAIRRTGYRQVSASKYCTANALLRAGLRINRLRPALRALEALAQ